VERGGAPLDEGDGDGDKDDEEGEGDKDEAGEGEGNEADEEADEEGEGEEEISSTDVTIREGLRVRPGVVDVDVDEGAITNTENRSGGRKGE